MLTPDVQERLFPYMSGALKHQDSPPVKVGGHTDHVHLLFRLSKNKSASKVVGEIKAQSSRWLKAEYPKLEKFSWQNGYGVFSVSVSLVDSVIEYIANQAEHHKRVSFQDEFRKFLDRHGVDYDERYLWD